MAVLIEVAPGTHSLQLFPLPGLESPVETFGVRAGETAAFSCHPPSLIAAIPRLVTALLLPRASWITLERNHHADENSSEHQGELINLIDAAQANQPFIQR